MALPFQDTPNVGNDGDAGNAGDAGDARDAKDAGHTIRCVTHAASF